MSLRSRAFFRILVMAIGLTFSSKAGAAQTEEIIRSILERPLNSSQVSQAYIHADGSLEGTFNGISFAGTWTLERGKYCRTFTRGLVGKPLCMNVTAEYAPDGAIRAVIFEGPGGRAQFEVGY